MFISFIKRILRRREAEGRSNFSTFTPEMLSAVEKFHREWQGFRSLDECARQTGYTVAQCRKIKEILYRDNLLGNYFFAPGVPPHQFMRDEMLRRISTISYDSVILEVGPGDHPLLPPENYHNWLMCDPGYTGDSIKFRELTWGQNRYPKERSYRASWENMADRLPEWHGKCDIVTGCHSYEHCYRPVTALRQAKALLKPGGWIVLFVPDGFSDYPSNYDPTHTLYVVPGMLEDFFEAAGGYCGITVESFRPNADLMILAQKVDMS